MASLEFVSACACPKCKNIPAVKPSLSWKQRLVLKMMAAGRNKDLVEGLVAAANSYNEGKYEETVKILDKLGGLWRKAAQRMFQMKTLIPDDETRAKCRDLLGNLEPRCRKEILRQIGTLGNIEIRDLKILGVGTMAEVVEATMMDGSKKVFKVVNKEQRSLIDGDVNFLENFDTLYEKYLKPMLTLVAPGSLAQIEAARQVTIPAMLATAEDMRRAMDMEYEGEMMQRFWDIVINCVKLPGNLELLMPKALRKECYVLEMTKVGGVQLSMRESKELDLKYAEGLVHLFVEMVRLGHLHIELHAANILVDGNKIALVDFGEVMELKEQERTWCMTLLKLSLDVMRGQVDADIMGRLLQAMGYRLKPKESLEKLCWNKRGGWWWGGGSSLKDSLSVKDKGRTFEIVDVDERGLPIYKSGDDKLDWGGESLLAAQAPGVEELLTLQWKEAYCLSTALRPIPEEKRNDTVRKIAILQPPSWLNKFKKAVNALGCTLLALKVDEKAVISMLEEALREGDPATVQEPAKKKARS